MTTHCNECVEIPVRKLTDTEPTQVAETPSSDVNLQIIDLITQVRCFLKEQRTQGKCQWLRDLRLSRYE